MLLNLWNAKKCAKSTLFLKKINDSFLIQTLPSDILDMFESLKLKWEVSQEMFWWNTGWPKLKLSYKSYQCNCIPALSEDATTWFYGYIFAVMSPLRWLDDFMIWWLDDVMIKLFDDLWFLLLRVMTWHDGHSMQPLSSEHHQ